MAKSTELNGKNIWRASADRPWLWRVHVNGKSHNGECLTLDKREALKVAAAAKARLKGEALDIKKANLSTDKTWGALCDAWIADVGENNVDRGQVAVARWLREIKGVIRPDTRPVDITNEVVLRVRKARQQTLHRYTDEPVSPRTVNMTMTLMRCVLRHGHYNYSAALAPIHWKSKMVKVPDHAIRILEDGEMAGIRKHMRADMHDALRFALASGKRIEELLALRWRDIKPNKEMVLTIKGGGEVRDPLGTDEWEVIERQRLLQGGSPAKDDYVFTFEAQKSGRYFHPVTKKLTAEYEAGKRYQLKYEHLQANLEEACEALGIEGVTIHVLRHTAATMMLRAEGERGIAMAMRMLNHTNPATTMRFYAKVMTEDVRRAKDKLAPQIAAMFGPRLKVV